MKSLMQALGICPKGIEDIASREVSEIISSTAQIGEGCIAFEIKTLTDLCKLAYVTQSLEKVLLLIAKVPFEDKENGLESIKKELQKFQWKDWLGKSTSFRISCQSISEKDLSLDELSAELGSIVREVVKELHKFTPKVDLDHPDIIFFAFFTSDACYLGVDFTGRDLHKREYKIFPHSSSLRGTIAYGLVRIAGFGKKESLMDPFAHSGEIPIEAAFFQARMPLQIFAKEKFAFLKLKPLKKFDASKFLAEIDKQQQPIKKPTIFCADPTVPNLTACKKNAKIAGLQKAIQFSRMDIEWLDTKFKKSSIDKIITHPPELSRQASQKDREKLYHEFFYQAEFILKKSGTITLIARDTEPFKAPAEKYKFSIIHERVIYSGKEPLKVVVFSH